MPTTPFMNLVLPVPTVTLGPEWAEELNTALSVIDSHDHSSSNGVQIKPGGLDINSDLDFQSNRAANLFSSKYTSQGAPLTGAANIDSVYVSSGDLYYTNSSGTAVQITSGSSVISVPAAASSFNRTRVNSSLTISSSDTFVVVEVDSSTGAHTITLPLAANVADGRLYVIKDVGGVARANPITIQTAGSDQVDDGSAYTLNSNYGAIMLEGDATSLFSII